MKLIKNEKNGLGISVTDFNAQDPVAVGEIKKLLYSNKIVTIKNQTLNEEAFCAFSRALGNPVPYLQENYHHPDFPLIFVSSNVKQAGKKIGVARTGGYWHSDTAFQEIPVPLTLLYPQIIPKNSARTTLFIDLQRAYEEMSPELQQRLATLRFIHSGKWRYKVREEDAGLDIFEIQQLIHKAQPPVIHPAVIVHPVTGQKILYATSGFTVGVEGLSTDEGDALLAEVFDFVERPRFITEFQWALGDLILWDNRFFAHKAGRLASANDPVKGDVASEEETLVYRIIIQDGHPLSA